MPGIKRRTAALLLAAALLLTVLHLTAVADGSGVEVQYTVGQVTELLGKIDTLQEMQDKRKTEFAASKRAVTSANFASNAFDEEALAEHETLAAAYEEYLDGMFALRAEAKAAYDSLSPEQQAEIPEALSGKLVPYDRLDTPLNPKEYSVLVPESEDSPYKYQLIGAYECSNHGCGEIPATMALIDTTDASAVNGDGKWAPDRLYVYGECNYDIVYCSDAHPSPSTTNLYKRINLEDSTYYSRAAARKLRAIVINSYPYVTIDEMKTFLKENGFDSGKADKLDRSEIIAGVQMAIWYYANIGNTDHEELTTYQYTFNNYKNPWMPNRIHQFQNECWTWWDAAGSGQFSAWRPYKTYLSGIADRINSLVDFLVSLPGMDPEDDQILISDMQITRSGPVPDSDGTYTVGLKVILNHGKSSAGDSVVLNVEILREGAEPAVVSTAGLSELSEYEFEVSARDGDRIRVTADGTQYLAKGVYCYETAAGSREDQALISVTEGQTRIHAEDTVVFTREGETGLRILKIARGEEHEYPISGIEFKVYSVPESETGTGEVPTAAEIGRIAVETNLAGAMTTDNSGYAYMDLPYGTYMLVEQPNEKVVAPSDPVYFTLPYAMEKDGTVIVADIAEIVVENTREDFETDAVELSVYKQFDDWGKADSFRFRLDPVTEGAPMPLRDTATATKNKPLAVFGKITFDAGCFDTGDPDSNVRVYRYTITEIDDHVPGVTYDTKPYPVTVTVTKTVRIDTEQNVRITEISSDIDYGGMDSIIITNTYSSEPGSAVIKITKELEGREWEDGDEFIFDIAAVTEGAPMPGTTFAVATKENRVAYFDIIRYTEPGVYVYTVTEREGNIPGVTYDTVPRTVTVTVTDVNSQLVAEVDYDGDPELTLINARTLDVLAAALTAAALSGAAAAGLASVRRRRSGRSGTEKRRG